MANEQQVLPGIQDFNYQSVSQTTLWLVNRLDKLWNTAPTEMSVDEYYLLLSFMTWASQPEVIRLTASIRLGLNPADDDNS